MQEYQRTARLYDPLVGPALRPIHRAMVDILISKAPANLVDLCCGTGLLAGQAARSGISTLGVDLSPDMLRVARDKRPHASYLHADATTLPLPDGSFDTATISFALHEKSAPVALGILAEARRVVRDNGRIIVADYLTPAGGQGVFTGRVISLIERLAGKEHYACFKEYMETGGTPSLLDRVGLTGTLVRSFKDGWVGLYTVA